MLCNNVTPHTAMAVVVSLGGVAASHTKSQLGTPRFSSSGPLKWLLSGQQFVNDNDGAAVMTDYRCLKRISLLRTAMHWFPAGKSASTGMAIM